MKTRRNCLPLKLVNRNTRHCRLTLSALIEIPRMISLKLINSDFDHKLQLRPALRKFAFWGFLNWINFILFQVKNSFKS